MKQFALGFAVCLTLVSVLAWAAAASLDIDKLAGQVLVRIDSQPARAGSGIAGSRERAVAEFDRVELRSGENLVVRIGPRSALTLHGDDNLLDLVDTRVEGGKLLIEASGSYRATRPVTIEVQVPRLRALELLGSADARVLGLAGGDFEIELNGSGNVEASGVADELDVELNGSGSVILGELKARQASAELNGSGDILLFAVDSLRADINGSGDIRYRGSPVRVESDTNGSGDLIRMD